MNDKLKLVCHEYRCAWHGFEEDVRVLHDDVNNTDCPVCPACGGFDTLVPACDEYGCWKESACGTPTDDGYRRTCGNHRSGRKS